LEPSHRSKGCADAFAAGPLDADRLDSFRRGTFYGCMWSRFSLVVADWLWDLDALGVACGVRG